MKDRDSKCAGELMREWGTAELYRRRKKELMGWWKHWEGGGGLTRLDAGQVWRNKQALEGAQGQTDNKTPEIPKKSDRTLTVTQVTSFANTVANVRKADETCLSMLIKCKSAKKRKESEQPDWTPEPGEGNTCPLPRHPDPLTWQSWTYLNHDLILNLTK